MKVFTTILFIVLSLAFYTANSYADVLIESGGINSFSSVTAPGMTNVLDIDTGPGQSGNYLLLTCVAFNNSSINTFNAPSPAIFTQQDLDNCADNLNCITGIWGGFTNNAASEMLTCNSMQTTVLFAGGTLRYSNVDEMNPVIGISCSEGMSNTATAPSIMTEAGSQVVRIFNSFAPNTEDEIDDIMVTPQSASFTSEATVDSSQISSIGTSALVNSDGPTGTGTQMYTGAARDWRACTIALRMVPDPPTMPPPTITPPPPTLVPPIITDVPTLSQWGHLSVALFLVLIGVWFLRRHKIKV